MDTDDNKAAVNLLIASRGAPQNKRLMKIFQQQGTKQLVHKMESEYIRDKKMPELDEQLYFSIDERAHVIDLSEIGRQYLSPDHPENFIIPDLGEIFHEIENTEPEKQPHQKINNSPSIKDIQICIIVVNRVPIGSDTYFLNNTDSLFCYTRIQNPGGKQQIAHLWYYKEKLISKIKYNIKRSNIYRSWTHNRIRSHQTGIWRVDVQDASGIVIGSKSFYITNSTISQ